jgi:hypothetical protein
MHADTLPVLPLEAAIGTESTRFDAVTRCGTMSLQLESPAAHAADAALLLDRCDALLDALDAWLHAALDWRWVEAAGADEAAPSRASAQATVAAGAGADAVPLIGRIELPWALLRTLGHPPQALAGQLQWNPVPAVLVVSRPAIDDAELRLLERGGAVVLPESMGSPWHACLHAAHEDAGQGVPAELASSASATLVAPTDAVGPAAQGPGRPCCEVRLTTTRPLTPGQLAGWAAGATIELAPRASLWRCAGPSEAERYLAGGRLIPWGDGWAMLIESV